MPTNNKPAPANAVKPLDDASEYLLRSPVEVAFILKALAK